MNRQRTALEFRRQLGDERVLGERQLTRRQHLIAVHLQIGRELVARRTQVVAALGEAGAVRAGVAGEAGECSAGDQQPQPVPGEQPVEVWVEGEGEPLRLARRDGRVEAAVLVGEVV